LTPGGASGLPKITASHRLPYLANPARDCLRHQHDRPCGDGDDNRKQSRFRDIASSALGTEEFLAQVSKFERVNSMARFQARCSAQAGGLEEAIHGREPRLFRRRALLESYSLRL
jgi:hypothetical protein